MRRLMKSTTLTRLAVITLVALIFSWPTVPRSAAAEPRSAIVAPLSVPGYLYGVAATSSSDAWAVGQSGGRTAGPLILRWNGKKWVQVPTPAGGGILRAVAAASASDAWAVGYSSPKAGTSSRVLILHWNGRHWTRAKIPVLGHDAVLSGIAAVSAGNAWAVGSVASVQPFGKTLILHWNGKTWSESRSPGDGYTLNSVAASRGQVWAVGNSAGPAGGPSFITRWNGKAWRQVKSPSPGGRSNVLNGVAVTAKDSAWSAGWYDEGQLMLHWNGKAWKQVRIPNGYLFAITATPAGDAWAVGQAVVDSSTFLIEKYNGKSWKPVSVPASAGHGELLAVTATSNTSAWAVGVSYKGQVRKTLILHWNGKSWQ